MYVDLIDSGVVVFKKWNWAFEIPPAGRSGAPPGASFQTLMDVSVAAAVRVSTRRVAPGLFMTRVQQRSMGTGQEAG